MLNSIKKATLPHTFAITTLKMDPQGPSQPSQQTGVEQSNNPASQTSAERNTAASNTTQNNAAPTIESRSVPSNRSAADSNPTSTAMGYGDRGPLVERDISASDAQNYGNKPELDGEQMAVFAEGDVASAVQGKGHDPRAGHAEEESLTENMAAKADAHEEELHNRGKRTGREIEEEEGEDWTGMRGKVDLNAALGRDGQDGEVTEVGQTERGVGVVLAAETVSGTVAAGSGDDAREGLRDA